MKKKDSKENLELSKHKSLKKSNFKDFKDS